MHQHSTDDQAPKTERYLNEIQITNHLRLQRRRRLSVCAAVLSVLAIAPSMVAQEKWRTSLLKTSTDRRQDATQTTTAPTNRLLTLSDAVQIFMKQNLQLI